MELESEMDQQELKKYRKLIQLTILHFMYRQKESQLMVTDFEELIQL